MPRRIAVWDAPVRLFHWALAALAVFSFVTAKVGGGWMEWHLRSGYAVLALLLFRLAWGVAGSQTARFASFLKAPRAAIDYARATAAGRHPAIIGHSPLGGWMVALMLALFLVQALSGLFADDEIATQGPLAVKVSNAFVSRMSAVHSFNEWLIVGAVALHVAAIAVYRWVFRTSLVRAMVTGTMDYEGAEPDPRAAPAWLAALLAAAAAAFVYWLVFVYPRGAA